MVVFLIRNFRVRRHVETPPQLGQPNLRSTLEKIGQWSGVLKLDVCCKKVVSHAADDDCHLVRRSNGYGCGYGVSDGKCAGARQRANSGKAGGGKGADGKTTIGPDDNIATNIDRTDVNVIVSRKS